nr:rec12 [Schizosaccharomyces pombe]
MTRKFLVKLAKALPDAKFFGIFDWDPHGLCIYSCFKYGSNAYSHEPHSQLRNLQLLGPLYEDIFNKNQEFSLKLNKRDIKMITTLLQFEGFQKEPVVREQLQRMLFIQKKAEIQAILEFPSWIKGKLADADKSGKHSVR